MASLKHSFASNHIVVEHKCTTTKASAKGPSIDHPAEKYVNAQHTNPRDASKVRSRMMNMQSILRHEAENAALKKTSFNDSKQVQVVYKNFFFFFFFIFHYCRVLCQWECSKEMQCVIRDHELHCNKMHGRFARWE